MRRIAAIVRKEWGEVFKNRFVLSTVAFLPVIMTALPLVMLFVTSRLGAEEMGTDELPAAFTTLCQGLSELECGQYFLVSQFMLLFLILPLAIPTTFASYSIIGEKTTRTLEPVLATPVTTLELLSGKIIAAAAPAVVATWLAYGVFLMGASRLVAGPAVLAKLEQPHWILAVFVLGPLLALTSVCTAVMVSSRVTDPRVAEQLTMLVILPLLGVFVAQIAGLMYIDETIVSWMAIGLVFIDAGLMWAAVRLFQRETILTRWK